MFSLSMLPERARGGSLARMFPAQHRLRSNPQSAENYSASKQFWLSVPLSWNEPSEGSFEIRYFVDDLAFNASDPIAPIFLEMGGEGGTHAASCSKLAKQEGALCVGVEHRFV